MKSSSIVDRSTSERLALGAVAGIVSGLAGCATRAPEAVVAIPEPTGSAARVEPTSPAIARHARAEVAERTTDRACCKGRNECKGLGRCRVAGINECRGRNECKGKGGCESGCDDAAPSGQKACCKGQNQCKGLGQCKTSSNACKGQNACKGMGGCKPASCGP